MQNYKNHIRFYAPHHFVFYPVMLLLIIISVRGIWQHPENRGEYILLSALAITVTWLSFMTRQHYALTVQNRLVRMEMRWRYHLLTGKRLEELEPKLSFGQIAALRFASDAELPALTLRAMEENLSPDAIKQQIVHWVADDMRV
ncbi:DUF6526 family protein [Parasegetibacter sp. NRK P23]|uniref:DUF6526 family protein n=1 Tax=Parasegetibacter sp. NRK P23 TaxID=2942999 RepID=UPI002043D3C2|nr:DUF6526 family protein [Parasegetibacter sp. NRK P23]MCM5529975.1 DUF6526 family protein [Parasegetibacter sp. NRK P23]